jgi:hypothetical protein
MLMPFSAGFCFFRSERKTGNARFLFFRRLLLVGIPFAHAGFLLPDQALGSTFCVPFSYVTCYEAVCFRAP